MSGKVTGDTGDLFRFDLVRHIMKSVPAFEGFTYMPVSGKDCPVPKKRIPVRLDLAAAIRAGKAGSQNRELGEHLDPLPDSSGENAYAGGIRAYFTKEHISAHVLEASRIPREPGPHPGILVSGKIPPHSLIVVDRVHGSGKSAAHKDEPFFAEISQVFDQMDATSALMVSVSLPNSRSRAVNAAPDLFSRFQNLTGIVPVTITDDNLVFYLMTKNQKFSSLLGRVVERYADTYPTLSSSYEVQ
ncbi:MAG: hypothetical protein WC342_05435 [Methanoregula sp.]|jgi:hypothetical protein